MQLVTTTEELARAFGDEECIRILARAGFDAIDWGFFDMVSGQGLFCQDGWKEHTLKLKALAQECGIGFSQAHAPFPSLLGEEPFDTVNMERILRSMQAAALMGVKNIIVHPVHHVPYPTNKAFLWKKNLEFYRSLIPYCEEYGIRVCAENMWQYDEKRQCIIESVCSWPEEFCDLLDELDSPWITGCLDIGHTALTGIDPVDFIRMMGKKRIQALHVQDVDHLHDCHTIPFTESLDWEAIAGALAEIGYEGDFTFEADDFLLKLPKPLKEDGSILMAKIGRYLIGRIEALSAAQNPKQQEKG